MLTEEIRAIVKPELCPSQEVYDRTLKRLSEGRLTIDENPTDHFPIYFLPFNPKTKQIFLVHHIKAQLWISPGGHIDEGESLLTTLNRELEEELGLPQQFKELPRPFLFTISNISNDRQTCKIHYDTWFLLETDGRDFQTDDKEFYNTEWVSISEAKQRVTDPANVIALNVVEKF